MSGSSKITEHRESILSRFQAIQIWQSGNSRAPHKPLLLLWAIGRCLHGLPRLATFETVSEELGYLLQQFGPPRRTMHTEDPFWRLQNDGIWEIDRPNMVGIVGNAGPSVKDLRAFKIRGGLKQDDHSAFLEDPVLAISVAEKIVAGHFPYTLQHEILQATLGEYDQAYNDNLEIPINNEWVLTRQRRRDSRFRENVLSAYGARCAVCEFSARFNNKPIALEAAHIMWHEAKGPAKVENGLALCSLHHRLFDYGAFTLQPNLNLVVANTIRGKGVDEALYRYHNQRLRAPPLNESLVPDEKYLAWHRSEVFKRNVAL